MCKKKKLTIATAESCTGGLVAGALTEMPGSSGVLDRGFVTYSNEAKQQMLGVPPATLDDYGAVSRQTAEAMARARWRTRRVDLAVSVTGIAGPAAAAPDKPVGLVHFAAAVARRPARCTREALRRYRPQQGAAQARCCRPRLLLNWPREKAKTRRAGG